MIGQTIAHYKILEKLGEARLRSSNFHLRPLDFGGQVDGQGGHVLRSANSIFKVPL